MSVLLLLLLPMAIVSLIVKQGTITYYEITGQLVVKKIAVNLEEVEEGKYAYWDDDLYTYKAGGVEFLDKKINIHWMKEADTHQPEIKREIASVPSTPWSRFLGLDKKRLREKSPHLYIKRHQVARKGAKYDT